LSAEGAPLLDLATSVADGTDVNWAEVESQAGDGARLVSHLRLVSKVAALYRSLPPDEQQAAGARAGEPAGPRWGHLVLLDRIGQGTSAEVHRAWDLELQREVALKLFSRPGPASDAALEEARRLARVRHRNVAVVFGADRHEDRAGFWMELVRGASLDEILDRHGAFSTREAALAGIDICGALAAVHGAGLLHRDIKAQNVLREDGGRIVLADFGTGEPLVSAAARPRMAGTPMYLAPEIFSGRPASVQSDLYSLGVLLFHLVTREFPVPARTLPDLARAHSAGTRRHLRDLRPDLEAPFVEVVERLLSSNPAERYQSAGALETALRATLLPEAAPTSQTTTVEGSRPAPSRRLVAGRSFLGAAAALALVVAALVFWSIRSSRSAAPPASDGVQAVAVLPLVDLTGGSGPPHLTEALTDQLISTLGQLRGLRVTSRTSVLPFASAEVSMTDIAKRLGVAAVLEGSLAMDPGSDGRPTRVRVNARLFRAGTEAQLWSGTFERALGDTFALQADLARAIAREVDVAIAPAEAARLDRSRQTSAAAEAAYFEGVHHLNNIGVESATRALHAFERATRLDVNYARAYVGIARAQIALGFSGAIRQQQARAKALAAVSRALELDDTLAEVHTTVGDLKFYYDWDWAAAERAYERAVALNPSSAAARMQFARYLSAMGRVGEAVQQAEQATTVDPLSASTVQTHALMLYYLRDNDQAAAVLERAEALDPASAGTYQILSRVREAQGRYAEALEAVDKALAIGTDPGIHAHAARLMALAGDRDAARARLREVREGALYVAPEYLAYPLLALGERDGALTLLEQAEAERNPGILWLAVDPRVDELRGDSRFAALLSRVGLPASLDFPPPAP
jgi:serine/threonine-protein kinase